MISTCIAYVSADVCQCVSAVVQLLQPNVHIALDIIFLWEMYAPICSKKVITCLPSEDNVFSEMVTVLLLL